MDDQTRSDFIWRFKVLRRAYPDDIIVPTDDCIKAASTTELVGLYHSATLSIRTRENEEQAKRMDKVKTLINNGMLTERFRS